MSYLNIIINNDDSFGFELINTKPKGSNAVSLLRKIEAVITNKMTLVQCPYFFEEDPYEFLREKAVEIRDGYDDKIDNVTWVLSIWPCRLFFNAEGKKERVKQLCDAIQETESSLLLSQPSEIIDNIISHLEPSDVATFASVCHATALFVRNSSLVDIARKYGFKGRNRGEAREYLIALQREVERILQNHDLALRFNFFALEERLLSCMNFRIRRDKILAYLAESSVNDLIAYLKTEQIYSFPKFTQCILALLDKQTAEVEFSISQPDLNSAFKKAAKYGSLEGVELLLKLGAQINCAKHYDSALCYAIRNQHTEIVRFLLENGANSEKARENTGWTAIHEAAAIGDVEILSMLIESKKENERTASLERKTTRGSTPLRSAAAHGKKDAFSYLISQGAKTHDPNIALDPLLRAAIRGKNTDIVNTILKNKYYTDINGRNWAGDTPLNVAHSVSNYWIITRDPIYQLLRANGARPSLF